MKPAKWPAIGNSVESDCLDIHYTRRQFRVSPVVNIYTYFYLASIEALVGRDVMHISSGCEPFLMEASIFLLITPRDIALVLNLLRSSVYL